MHKTCKNPRSRQDHPVTALYAKLLYIYCNHFIGLGHKIFKKVSKYHIVWFAKKHILYHWYWQYKTCDNMTENVFIYHSMHVIRFYCANSYFIIAHNSRLCHIAFNTGLTYCWKYLGSDHLLDGNPLRPWGKIPISGDNTIWSFLYHPWDMRNMPPGRTPSSHAISVTLLTYWGLHNNGCS